MSYNNNDEKKDQLIKVITLGASGAGKTSLLTRMTRDQFSENYIATIGCDFAIKRLFINNQPVKLQIWDTAGQERFRTAISKSYYRGANGIFLVFDISNEQSFTEMQLWYQKTQEEIKNMNQDIQFLLIGCKCDLEQQRQISYDVAFSFAQSLGMHYIETSAKRNTNCLEAAECLGKICLQKINEKLNQEQPVLEIKQDQLKKSSCC
ncbi:unnamed protein product (macronuclear) [Paramecium tetraurelia]|uniref:Chromosome undetermined scaffold_78, whole genome shotgun sequence n=1 Tax=Paramecium tetraurelia TaxID=5888 RepID=Q3SD70_PARTE|nr:uncharacterized protein GSPATT00023307001 [Paramecium tetraurelia]CAI44495.1 rab_C45 [Paramecium tetraurelia]CAK90133.1 unnamed protein product [Paramecium tetraurelia]|eukprot:XP_001457530.1 hypothetical protein (macronuclear) [Paramecium tetraurelia strain d4-2]